MPRCGTKCGTTTTEKKVVTPEKKTVKKDK
jgi:hypothetical protein